MKIVEIADLISIRNYVANSINNFSLKREHVRDLDKTLALLDNILVEEITGDSFKETISPKSKVEK